jgi:hypothetical protein
MRRAVSATVLFIVIGPAGSLPQSFMGRPPPVFARLIAHLSILAVLGLLASLRLAPLRPTWTVAA